MTKAWFTHIIQHYPKAYYHCLYQFKDLYPKDWKPQMRNADQLVTFFTAQQITIKLVTEFDNYLEALKYGFEITSELGPYELQSGFQFEKEHYAKWPALEFAFFVLNFQKRRREKAKPRKSHGVTRYKR